MDMNKEELWAENIGFYHELVEKYHFQLEQMIILFTLLKQAGFFEKYYPSNSHESLGISTVFEYQNRLVNPMVYLTYNPQKHSFEIVYQQGQNNTVAKEEVGAIISPEILSKIDLWLSVGKLN